MGAVTNGSISNAKAFRMRHIVLCRWKLLLHGIVYRDHVNFSYSLKSISLTSGNSFSILSEADTPDSDHLASFTTSCSEPVVSSPNKLDSGFALPVAIVAKCEGKLFLAQKMSFSKNKWQKNSPPKKSAS